MSGSTEKKSFRTEEALWTIHAGEERPGFLVYGLWNQSPVVPVKAMYPYRLEPYALAIRASHLWGPGWLVLFWDVAIDSWPASEIWIEAIDQVLGGLLEAGASVAWCATEACFAEPPLLFDPEAMDDCVFAASTPESGLIDCASTGQPVEFFSGKKLLRLQRIVALSCGEAE